MIELQGVYKNFQIQKKSPGLVASIKSLVWRETTERYALKPIDVKIEPGEFVGLLGANGAGKTTLVKICTGIVHKTGGQIRVLGQDPWQRNDDFRRKISLIMGQKAQLWWDLPAADCFLLLKEIYRIPDYEYKTRLSHLVDVLDVGAMLNVQIRRLSLGERMKMELVAALLHEPQLIFLDEPTIGLDISSQRALRSFIQSYHREKKPTVVLTSHYIEDIESLCNRIIVLRDGSIVYDGALRSLVDYYGAQKTIQFTLPQEENPSDNPQLAEIQKIIQRDGHGTLQNNNGVISIQIDRDRVSESVSIILKHIKVSDLSIIDADVAGIIARIQSRDQSRHA